MSCNHGGHSCKWHLQLHHFLQLVVNTMGPCSHAVMASHICVLGL